MAMTHISAPDRERTGSALSADNANLDRFALMKLLRQAAPALGLKPPVLATLEVLLSFLPPKRAHHMVFASNQTLIERRNGICERSLRRHIVALEEAGLLSRHDSPNGKRFSRSNPKTGMALRFGFDLTALFERGNELAALAEAQQQQSDELRYLRLRVRSLLARLIDGSAATELLEAAQKLLRRRCEAEQLEAMIAVLAPLALPEQEEAVEAVSAQKMSAADGQFVRHHQRSKTELKDKSLEQCPEADEPIDLSLLLQTCPEATEFALQPIRTEHDALQHAQTLAPMLGIMAASYEQAKHAIGVRKTALAVWVLLSMQGKIRNFAAYFHAVTLGQRRSNFNPWAILRQRQRSSAFV